MHLLVVCTSERGLCGPFNSAIVRLARERANALIAEGKEVKIFCVGRKGYEQLRRVYEKHIIEHIELRAVRTLGFTNAEEIGDKIVRLYEQGVFDVATLFFSRSSRSWRSSRPRNRSSRRCSTAPPATVTARPTNTSPTRTRSSPIFSRATFRPDFPRAPGEFSSFYGAQMTAMDNATRNAGEMIKKQTLKYNRTRQANITKELIEIISGAEAL